MNDQPKKSVMDYLREVERELAHAPDDDGAQPWKPDWKGDDE